MRILYVLSGSTIYAGATKAFMGLLDCVLDQGVQVAVLCPEKNGIYDELIHRGVDVIVSDVRFTIWPIHKGIKHKLLFIPRLIYRNSLNVLAYLRLLRFAKKWKPDIIHSNVSVVDIGFKVARRIGVQHVWHIREYGDFDFDIAPTYGIFLRKLNADGNFCVSITEGVKEHHHLSDSKCEVIYDGVMSASACRYNSEKSPYFLFAGRLEEAKGIEFCIKAYTQFYNDTKTKTELWVAGSSIDNQYYDYLKKLAGSAPVKFLGMRKDVYDLMYNAKALIVPSRHEGFGFITAEAMFNGCLVLGRNTSGTKEQMDNGLKETGSEIALRFETLDELISQMKEVEKNDVEYYYDMIMKAQKVVHSNYTKEAHASKVMILYRRLLGQKISKR